MVGGGGVGDLFETVNFFATHARLFGRQVDEAVAPVVLGVLAQGVLLTAVDVERLVGAFVDVAQLDGALEVGDLLCGEPLHAQVFGVGEDEDDLGGLQRLYDAGHICNAVAPVELGFLEEVNVVAREDQRPLLLDVEARQLGDLALKKDGLVGG